MSSTFKKEEKDKIFQSLEEKTICPINTNHLICPISNQIMHNPVKASDGRTYDREYLKKHIATLHEEGKPIVSPLTREILRALNPSAPTPIDRYMLPDFELRAIIDNAGKIQRAVQNAAEYLHSDSSSDDEANTSLHLKELGYYYEDPEGLIVPQISLSQNDSDIEEETSSLEASDFSVLNTTEPEHQHLNYDRNRFFTNSCRAETAAATGVGAFFVSLIGGAHVSHLLSPVTLPASECSWGLCMTATGTLGCILCTIVFINGTVAYAVYKGANFEAQYYQNQIDNASPPQALDMVEDNPPQNLNEEEYEESVDINNPDAALIPPQVNTNSEPSEEETSDLYNDCLRLSRCFG